MENDQVIDEIMNNPIFKKYPILYPVAEIYGFNIDDIDEMIQIFEQSKLREFMTNPLEVGLRALFVRLDVHKRDFKGKIKELSYLRFDEQRNRIGIRLMPYVYELYLNWR